MCLFVIRSSPARVCVFSGEVRMPSGKTARPHITDNKDGTVTVKYSPTEKGLHEMDIKYDSNHIPGTHAPTAKHTRLNTRRHVSPKKKHMDADLRR